MSGIRLENLIKKLNLTILYEGNLNVFIKSPSIYQIGYELMNFFEASGEFVHNIHIYGRKESRYLNSLTPQERMTIFDNYFKYDFPALIITEEGTIFPEVLICAKKYNKNILKSHMRTTATIREAKFYLAKKLAHERILEGYVCMDIMGIGVLITGYTDAKLGVTIELLESGHRFITDNHLLVKRIAEDDLEGYNLFDKSNLDSHFFLHNPKDKSKIDITTLFGIKATRKKKRIDLIIVLEEWQEKKFYDRLGLDTEYENILGGKIERITLPVRKGRNLAIIIETAALNYRLKVMGVDSARYFMEESKKLIKKNKERKGEKNMLGERGILVSELIKEFNLEILTGKNKIDDTYILTTSVHRPSLALAGYVENYKDRAYNGVQVFSKAEFNYLTTLSPELRIKHLENYLDFKLPLLILTRDIEIPQYFLDLIKKKDLILCRSEFRKASQVIANLSSYLETIFTPSIAIHGVFVELYGFGVLLTGRSGIGKSETALELIHRGHRLIADDLVKFIKDTSGDIMGTAANLPYFMEIRGLGIIDIKTLYGLGSVRINKKLDIIIELQEQEHESDYLTAVDYKSSCKTILGNYIPKMILQISSGRNAAAMVEIAVMNVMARKLGHDPDKLYEQGLLRMTDEEKKVLGRK